MVNSLVGDLLLSGDLHSLVGDLLLLDGDLDSLVGNLLGDLLHDDLLDFLLDGLVDELLLNCLVLNAFEETFSRHVVNVLILEHLRDVLSLILYRVIIGDLLLLRDVLSALDSLVLDHSLLVRNILNARLSLNDLSLRGHRHSRHVHSRLSKRSRSRSESNRRLSDSLVLRNRVRDHLRLHQRLLLYVLNLLVLRLEATAQVLNVLGNRSQLNGLRLVKLFSDLLLLLLRHYARGGGGFTWAKLLTRFLFYFSVYPPRLHFPQPFNTSGASNKIYLSPSRSLPLNLIRPSQTTYRSSRRLGRPPSLH